MGRICLSTWIVDVYGKLAGKYLDGMGKVNFQTIWFQTEYCMILLGLRRFLFQNSIQKQQCLKKLLGISRNMKFASF